MSSETPTSIRKLKVAELREKCQLFGLDNKGTKPVLIDRIFAHLGYSTDENQDGSITQDDSTALNHSTSDKEVKPRLSLDGNQKSAQSLKNMYDSQTSDMDKQEVELDFVHEDLQEIHSPTIESTLKRSKSNEVWEDEVVLDQRIAQASSKPTASEIKKIHAHEPSRDYVVKYMDYVHLDPYVNDGHFTIEDEKYLIGSNLTASELNNFWCGVKATHGISSGHACFSCKYLTDLPVTARQPSSFGFRVGFSSLCTSLHLGDAKLSCGYDSRGKIIGDDRVLNIVERFEVGDTVTALIAVSSETIVFSFRKNDSDIGTPVTINISSYKPITMFPHVYFKNCKFQVDFSCSHLNYQSMESIRHSLVLGPRPPVLQSECELIMMVGIMASGKSEWVRRYIETATKRYDVIGRSFLFDRWRLIGDGQRQHLPERLVSHALSKLMELATTRVRNYIIDQTNFTSSTRKRRLEGFLKFGTRRAVLVLPRLSEHAQRVESYKKISSNPESDYRHIHPDDMTDYKERMSLPTLEEGFTEIFYVDCDEKTAADILSDYKYDAKKYRELNSQRSNIPIHTKRPRIPAPEQIGRPPKRRFSPRPRRPSPPKRAPSPLKRPRDAPRSRTSPRPRSPYKGVAKSTVSRPPPRQDMNERMRDRMGSGRPNVDSFKSNRQYNNKSFEPAGYRAPYSSMGRGSSSNGSRLTGRIDHPAYSSASTQRQGYSSRTTGYRVGSMGNNEPPQRRDVQKTYDSQSSRYEATAYPPGKNFRNNYMGYSRPGYRQ